MQVRSHFLNRHGAGAVAAAALALAIAPEARAGNCSDLSADANIVYVTGSSAAKPFLAKVAAQMLGETPPIYVVYLSQGSCAGVASMTTTPAAGITGTGAVIWDNTGAAIAGGCDLDLAPGNTVDIGASDVYASTCGGAPVTSDVKDVHGPNQIMTFAVPKASTANSISAEAAYLVYGFGAASHAVAPWTDPNLIYQRNGGSGTQNMLGTAIGVPAASWKPTANTNGSSDLLFAALTTAATNGNANKAIGILATDYVDLHRDAVKALAYQHTGQSCGYTPDSSGATFDKVNVRDGHYMVWGPLHLYVHTAAGTALKASTQKVLDLLSLATTVSDTAAQTLITTEAKGGVVPDCAMHVSRTTEVGPLASYQPAKGCECKFLKESTAPLPSDCKSCTGDGDCVVASGARGTHCNYGYCEVK